MTAFRTQKVGVLNIDLYSDTSPQVGNSTLFSLGRQYTFCPIQHCTNSNIQKATLFPNTYKVTHITINHAELMAAFIQHSVVLATNIIKPGHDVVSYTVICVMAQKHVHSMCLLPVTCKHAQEDENVCTIALQHIYCNTQTTSYSTTLKKEWLSKLRFTNTVNILKPHAFVLFLFCSEKCKQQLQNGQNVNL